ncbi:MAG: hypothetical protein U5J95_12940 [Balneolaceae bacterium]|nr:hypothetical protein [Balneolaceae bacterium]
MGITFSGYSQATLGAREISLGQATSALPNSTWAVFANPAMSSEDRKSVSFFGIRYYGFSELTDMAVAATYPTEFGVIGAGVYRYGDDLFNENQLRVSYKNSFQGFHYGAALNYNHVVQGDGHGSFGALGINVGLAAQIIDNLWIGAKATNINQPKYGEFNNIAEEPVRDLSIGFAYQVSDLFLFTSDVYKDVRFPVSYRGGAEIKIIENLRGRAGVTTEPLTFSAGFGYNTDLWGINIVAQQHENPVLGISPGLDLNITW